MENIKNEIDDFYKSILRQVQKVNLVDQIRKSNFLKIKNKF